MSSLATIVNDANGSGVPDVENNCRPPQIRIASFSKSLTATAAMRLVEEHKLDLDTIVQTYCSAFPMKQCPIAVRVRDEGLGNKDFSTIGQ